MEKLAPVADFAIKYRYATWDDSLALIELVNRAFAVEEFLEGTRTDEERMRATFAAGRVMMAESEAGQLLGCLSMELRPGRAYLGMLTVAPEQQGRGVGRRMNDEACRRLQAEGCKAVEIVVLSLRPELVPLYQSWGFQVEGPIEFKTHRQLKPGFQCHGMVLVREQL